MSFTHRYIPVGLLEVLPAHMNERALPFKGRDELEVREQAIIRASPIVDPPLPNRLFLHQTKQPIGSSSQTCSSAHLPMTGLSFPRYVRSPCLGTSTISSLGVHSRSTKRLQLILKLKAERDDMAMHSHPHTLRQASPREGRGPADEPRAKRAVSESCHSVLTTFAKNPWPVRSPLVRFVRRDQGQK